MFGQGSVSVLSLGRRRRCCLLPPEGPFRVDKTKSDYTPENERTVELQSRPPRPPLPCWCVSGGEGLFCLPAIRSKCVCHHPCICHQECLWELHISARALPSAQGWVYSDSRSSLFRVMAWAARARGPCCVKWYPKRTIDGHCSSTVAISISTASPGHWRWRVDEGWKPSEMDGSSSPLGGSERALIWLSACRP